ncbi:MAG: hypothetical protein KDA41_16265, partial [Planctomycetales bacterium]|nr:hypothetical protein [Planctomycetales bacterium]
YVIIPAAACWLGGMIIALRRGVFRASTATCDAAGLLIGGLIAGGAGCWWLSATGSWAPFWEIVLHWSGEYRTSVGGWGLRLATNLSYYVYYAPWSLLALVAVPLAVRNCIDALAPPAKVSPDSGAAGRLLLSLLYLAWLVQASLIQLSHEYVLAVPLMIGLALLVAWDRVARPSPGMQGALALFVLVALAVHPLARPRALAAWPLCASAGSTPEVKDRLSTGAKRSVMGEAHWQDLAKVADFLRSQNIHDGELACWDDSSQALYTQLHISPSSRFVHVANWLVFFPSRRQEIMHDVLAGRPRFVVTDVQMAGYSAFLARDDHQRDEAVWPDGMPPRPDQFPWNQPIVFRAGRYLVFAVGDESLPASSTEASR